MAMLGAGGGEVHSPCLRRDSRAGVGGTFEATVRGLSACLMTGGRRGMAMPCGTGGALWIAGSTPSSLGLMTMSAGLKPVLRWAKLFGAGKGRDCAGRELAFCLCLAGRIGGGGCSGLLLSESWGMPTTVTTRRFLGLSWSSSRVRLRGADMLLKAWLKEGRLVAMVVVSEREIYYRPYLFLFPARSQQRHTVTPPATLRPPATTIPVLHRHYTRQAPYFSAQPFNGLRRLHCPCRSRK